MVLAQKNFSASKFFRKINKRGGGGVQIRSGGVGKNRKINKPGGGGLLFGRQEYIIK